MIKRCIVMMMAMGLGLAAQAAVTNQWTLIAGDWSDTNLWESVPIPQNIDDVALLSGNIGGSRTVVNDLASLTLGGLEIGRNKNLQQQYVKLIGNAVTFESSTGTAYLYKPSPSKQDTPNQNSIIDTDIILKSNLTIENVHPYDPSYLLLGGTISETGGVRSITIDAGGSTRLTGANSYSGGTTLNSGLLRVYDKEALGSGALDIQSGATAYFNLSGKTLTNQISNAGDMLLIGNANLSGDISGSGSLSHPATGGFTLKLLGDNAGFSGSITNSGILQVGHENALGSGTVYLGDGVESGNLSKAVGAHFYLTGDHAIENNIVLQNDGNSIGNNQGPMELAGVISGDYDLAKVGGGLFTLSSSNTWSGGITVTRGTLVGGADGAFSSGDVTVSTSTNDIITLSLTNGVLNDYIADTATLVMDTNVVLNLDFTGSPDQVAALSLDGGTTFLANGTYDATALASAGGNGTYTGTGSLKVGEGVVITEIGPVGVGLLSGGTNLALSWATVNGGAYGVQTNVDLVYGSWGTVQSVIGDGGTLAVTNAVAAPEIFFRIIAE